eukprot:TRINITY_DN7707_c0_g1_i4.p1 TRINITY_DN7707_c0_g1~~TRINITY_DN7707_c0_g1_i4.p1  ORF type:complete len:139 (+),score=40.12 TRINITY_DN7707_c0_g1_i4:116-532(+)
MEERRTYTEVTKEILFKANSNVRAITKILKLPSDETVLDYAEVKDHIDDITKCIEALSKVYAVSEEEFSKTAPRVELELKNDYMFTPEENPRNSGTANADIKSLLVKYEIIAKDELKRQMILFDKCKAITESGKAPEK